MDGIQKNLQFIFSGWCFYVVTLCFHWVAFFTKTLDHKYFRLVI
jgi:hypothetical protein